MRAFVPSLLLVASFDVLLSGSVCAQTGVYLPPGPQGPGGEDTIETSSGTRCRQSINSNGGYVDIGVAASGRAGYPNQTNAFISVTERDREATLYARVTVPLGKKPTRIDCSRVYELEIQRLQQEVELLKINAR